MERTTNLPTINLENVEWTPAAYEPYREIVDFACGCIGKAATEHSKEIVVIECDECAVLSGVLSGEIVPEEHPELLETTQRAIWAKRNASGVRRSDLQIAVESQEQELVAA